MIELFKKYEHLIKSTANLINYIRFCEEKKTRINDYFTESHHILPRALFPEYSKESWNIVDLKPSEHYEAHRILAHALSHRSVLFAFNQMRRVKEAYNEQDYDCFREDISRILSEVNSGKKRSFEHRMAVSEAQKGKCNYKNNKTGKIQKYEVGCAPSDWHQVRVGYTQPDDVKQKIGASHRGRKYFTNGKEIIFERECPDGFVKYENENMSLTAKDRFSGASFYHNPETKEQKRIKRGEEIPEGFVKGRSNFGQNNPFSGTLVQRNIFDLSVIRSDEWEEYHIHLTTKFIYVTETHAFRNSKLASEFFNVKESLLVKLGLVKRVMLSEINKENTTNLTWVK